MLDEEWNDLSDVVFFCWLVTTNGKFDKDTIMENDRLMAQVSLNKRMDDHGTISNLIQSLIVTDIEISFIGTIMEIIDLDGEQLSRKKSLPKYKLFFTYSLYRYYWEHSMHSSHASSSTCTSPC